MEAEQRLTVRLRAAEMACSVAQDAERAARGHAGATDAASAAAREAASSVAAEAADARQRCELERRRCDAAGGLRLHSTALLAIIPCAILCKSVHVRRVGPLPWQWSATVLRNGLPLPSGKQTHEHVSWRLLRENGRRKPMLRRRTSVRLQLSCNSCR